MKLFQKLLLAPAALGLLAPVAANAADVNIAGLSQYGTEEQVTSITQFSDVQPTDWAYQALSNLIERYGCVAGYPNGTYRGNRAMTRYEAAALLNACLDRITEVTDELKRLMKEFERELAVLRGRVDGLEARVGELEATQFSTTTKLRGLATFVVGANSFTGTSPKVDANKSAYGATTFNYDLRLILDSSFTGKDLLRTVLRAGDFNGSAYFNGLTALEVAFQSPAADDVVAIKRLFYNFPVGKDFSVTAGATVRVDDAGMLGMWPSVYPADTVLDFFTYAGAPGAYDLDGLGAGFGATYNNVLGFEGVTLSSNYVSINGGEGDAGLMTDASSSVSVTQLGYTGGKFPIIGGSAWGAAAAYTYSQNNALFISTPFAQQYGGVGSTNSFGLSGYWVPENTGWIPSVSTGWGTSSFENGPVRTDTWGKAQSWYVGLQWPDTFVKGNDLGMAVGQAPFITSTGYGASAPATPMDSNYMWEWWYKFQVTDNITVTPALYYIQNYDGQLGKVSTTGAYNATDNVFGGLLKTTFKF
ncbi:iron uptake porin [Synechococcus sp. A10-1-5-1]|uniref:iron uptake porin n=1 Tax=Synechococcus sp. A10-1-5-1 TaxID=2936507 RepID=UPI00200105C3|nr:iron uptake porin [Synechococcus sp. A10-1-5-1]UPM49670.1 iron uptake porin [Synechococcus sp. A10-1-5-1]